MAKMELWNFRSLEISFPGTFAPGSESSRNFRSQELLLQGATVATVPRTFAPRNFRSLELSPSGAKVPRTFAPTIFVHGYVRIRGCVPVLMFVLQTPYRPILIKDENDFRLIDS